MLLSTCAAYLFPDACSICQVVRPAMEVVRSKRRAREEQLGIIGKPALTLAEKINIDESMLDLNAMLIAAFLGPQYLVLRNEKCNIKVPTERSRHVTLLMGNIGNACLPVGLIAPRKMQDIDDAR